MNHSGITLQDLADDAAKQIANVGAIYIKQGVDGPLTRQALDIFLAREIQLARHEFSDLTTQAAKAAARITQLEAIRAGWTGPRCTVCDGHGLLRHQIAQDGSEVVKCSACGGTGRA